MLPLSGITVIDVTTNISGPTLTMILGDLGAEVIKVEKPVAGDEARKMEPKKNEDGVYFLNINRQKKSVVLNLKEQSDLQAIYRLIETADVFVENYRAGIADKIGLGYDKLKEINPSLIYCSLSAYGVNGPKRDYPGYDAIIQAETGLMSITGSEDLARIPVSIVDQGSAMWGALGVVSAVLNRVKTGEGAKVSTSLYETGIFWSNYHLLSTNLTGNNPSKLGSNHGAFSPYGAFRTKDAPIMIGISNNSLFEKLCTALGVESWIQDELFATNADRVKNRSLLNARIEEITLKQSSNQLVEKLETFGIPVAKVKAMTDVLIDPQQIENECIVKLPHERDGESFVTRLPITFSNCDITPKVSAPMYGEHSEEVLKKNIEGRI
ncbi:MAG TPA: CoA transferase [Ureibacillus sp.]|nr:CoA transferase [Ureibacillus sp.]